MRFSSALAACLVTVALWNVPASATAPGAENWNEPAIAWQSLKNGIPEAARTGKTVMMVFHAPWCTACAKFRSVFKDERVVAASKDVIMVLIDADADKVANGAFAPDGTYVPRTIFMTPDGDVRSDLVGKSDPKHPHTIDIEKPDELLALMQKAAGENGSSGTAGQRAAN